ncbi:SIS domain-containing protein [Oricola sp.]|uniref:SIS domain-containing protein n=1 Tax=Oricola sp. TaxID=1979950 RepID=UPI003BA9A56F
MNRHAHQALAEIGEVMDCVEDTAVEHACAMIAQAHSIMAYGCGREALQLRGFAMRLFHLGLNVAMQGDMTAPPLRPGDLFVASAGPGELATVTALMQKARDNGASVLFLTAEPDTPAAVLADLVLTIPAQTMARDTDAGTHSILPMGSVYEGTMFVLFEIMVLRLRDMLGATPDAMRARHTNME